MMATMNPNQNGGPVQVGGGMMMMMGNTGGSPAMGPGMAGPDQSRRPLNGYIMDYLLKHGHYDAARALAQDASFEFNKSNKSSPNGKRNGADMNAEGDTMDMDAKDDAPEDITRPNPWDGTTGSGFLLEWFNVFSDIFGAHRGQRNNNNSNASNYIAIEKTNQRAREMGNPMLQRGMNPAMMARMNGPNGNMNKQQITNQQIQMMNQQKRAAIAAQQMNRVDQPDQELNGMRPATPAEGESGGSPSKRQRMNDGQQNFANGMVPNGRAGAPQNAQGQMLMQSFQPGAQMTPQMRQNGAMPPKNMQGPMAPNMMMNAGSPMMPGMGQYPDAMAMNFEMQRNMGQNGQPQMQGAGGAQSGNHALQDYQMQLMLLEQQNKKRLMMARQEQHENNPAGGQMPGVTMAPSGMSPNGSRTGTSPNPDMAGRSPTAMNNWMMQGGDMGQQMYMNKDGQMQMAGVPPGMRPPTSNADMNAMRQAGPRPAQFPGGQPMVQQGSQAGNQIGTPGNRDMPPPQAPAQGSAQRNQGNSPNNGNAPPTPSQSNKAPPKGKAKAAAKEDNAKKRAANKKNAAANNGNNDDNPPATPTPSTPITPNNPGMNGKAPAMPAQQQQHPAGQNMPMNQGMPGGDMQFNFPDAGNAENSSYNVNLDFSTLENSDVLENFDFDSFLNTSAEDQGMGFGDDFTDFS